MQNMNSPREGILKKLYHTLVEIDDTPQKIASGAGLGIFLGVLPGTGPVAALTLALFFKLNRAAALAGSLLTNTWINFVTFPLAVKLGSIVLRLDWRDVYRSGAALVNDFSWRSLFALVFTKAIFALLLGYLLVGLVAGIFVYFIALAALSARRK